jgi:3-deoxy-D-manno-octulosonate 8-phosphate phosphatase (KDO 8-P phosphatase)
MEGAPPPTDFLTAALAHRRERRERRTLAERCRAVRLLVLDVDGVLTAGGICLAEPAAEHKVFHVRDGSALKLWHRAGHHSAVITGRSSPLVQRRAAELGIATVVQGAADKLAAWERIVAEAGLPPEAVACVGDDLPDLGPLCRSGLAVAVADACPEARWVADYITAAPGGGGAVREVVALILRCQGLWRD